LWQLEGLDHNNELWQLGKVNITTNGCGSAVYIIGVINDRLCQVETQGKT